MNYKKQQMSVMKNLLAPLENCSSDILFLNIVSGIADILLTKSVFAISNPYGKARSGPISLLKNPAQVEIDKTYLEDVPILDQKACI